MSDTLSRPHFDAIARRYAGATGGLDPLYAAARAELDAAVSGKDVLDAGSGGVLPFDRGLARSVTALDLSPAMLARAPEGVATVIADARDMRPLEDASFDAVLFNLSLHHFVGSTAAETERGQEAAVAEAFRVLRPGGNLIVYEPVLPPALFAAQRALFRPLAALCALAGTPPVYFRSRAAMTRLADFRVVAPRIAGWVDPLGGTFPGLVRLPASFFPTRFELFFAGKPRA